ncbi:hypothetical protein V2J67_25995 [Pseudomonas alliivorans]|nr:hypothetical protein [Pseudomonas alliivorans]MEE4999524.1 hypothetical protein [Pseudomonas alliivorans]
MATLSTPRRLSEAVGAWMHLEYCCYRAGLFSESALKASIGHILSTTPIKTPGAKVHAEFKNPALNTQRRSGAPNKVDFALVLKDSKADGEVYIETKWAGSSHCKGSEILKDFIRLGNIKKAEPSSKCIFLIAGKSTLLNPILKKFPFRTLSQKPNGFQLTRGEVKTTFNNLDSIYFSKASPVFSQLIDAGIIIPEYLTTCCHGIYPTENNLQDARFQAVAWEIIGVGREIKKSLWYREKDKSTKNKNRAKK